MRTTSTLSSSLRWMFCWVIVCAAINAAHANVEFSEVALETLGHVPPEAQFIRVNETGTLAVYSVKHDGKESIMLNGKEGPEFDWVDYPNFGRDGQHVQYFGNRGGKRIHGHVYPPMEGGSWFKVIDNQEPIPTSGFSCQDADGTFDNLWQASSTDGKKVAAVSEGPGRWCMVVNGKKENAYDWLAWPVFSPDGERLAYEASNKPVSQSNCNSFVVVDGKEGSKYDQVLRDQHGSSIRFSLDSKHVVYAGLRSGFQDDGKYGTVHYIVLDGQEERRSNYQMNAPDPVFSGDSKWIAYGNSYANTYTVTVRSVDGDTNVQSQPYRKVWLPSDQSTDIIHFFALRDQTIYRVEVK